MEQTVPSPRLLLARFRRAGRGRVSEQDLILIPTSVVAALEESRDMTDWVRLDLPKRAGLVPIALSLFLSPVLALSMAMGGPDAEDGDDVDVPPPAVSMANARIRPQRWPRGLPCPGGLDDDD